jgi:hypothetical protein
VLNRRAGDRVSLRPGPTSRDEPAEDVAALFSDVTAAAARRHNNPGGAAIPRGSPSGDRARVHAPPPRGVGMDFAPASPCDLIVASERRTCFGQVFVEESFMAGRREARTCCRALVGVPQACELMALGDLISTHATRACWGSCRASRARRRWKPRVDEVPQAASRAAAAHRARRSQRGPSPRGGGADLARLALEVEAAPQTRCFHSPGLSWRGVARPSAEAAAFFA